MNHNAFAWPMSTENGTADLTLANTVTIRPGWHQPITILAIETLLRKETELQWQKPKAV